MRWLLPLATAALLGMPERIGEPPLTVADPQQGLLRLERDGDALRLRWHVPTATHAVLHISDGKYKSKLELTADQVESCMFSYWPESRPVAFRLEVFTPDGEIADTVQAMAVSTAAADD